MFNGARIHSIQAVLTQGRLQQALALLNAGVPHRFTAAYSVEGAVLLNRGFVDQRGEPIPDMVRAVPVESSFCQFVIRDNFFQTHDSARDPRLDGHRLQGVIPAYVAAPITDYTGRFVIGSICHFDFEPRCLSLDEVDLLKRAGRMVTARMLFDAPAAAAAPGDPGAAPR